MWRCAHHAIRSKSAVAVVTTSAICACKARSPSGSNCSAHQDSCRCEDSNVEAQLTTQKVKTHSQREQGTAGSGRVNASLVPCDRPLYHWLPFWQSHLQTHGIPFSSAALLLTLADRYSIRKLPRISKGIAGFALVSCLLEKAWRTFKPSVSLPIRDVAVAKDSYRINTGNGEIDLFWTCASMQGWRPTMEDAHIAQVMSDAGRALGVFGVFDGHGGWEVAAVVRDLFPQMFLRGFSKSEISKQSLETLLAETVENLDFDLKGGPMGLGHFLKEEGHLYLNPFGWTGSTACVAVLDPQNGHLVVSNTGDSRAVLCRDGHAVPLTSDHRVQDEEEAKRIINAGGFIWKDGPCFRVDGFLNMSRALGDFHYKANSKLPANEQKIIAMPTVTTFSWNPSCSDEFLVVGCDGIFERMSCDDVVEHIQTGLQMGVLPEDVTKGLLHTGCANFPWEDGQDNQTVILVQWRSSA